MAKTDNDLVITIVGGETMSFKPKRIPVMALLLLFATGQVYVGARLAQADSGMPGEKLVMTPQQTRGVLAGILTTQGNSEIIVNGTNSITGATILSGASMETPGAVGATVSLGGRGSVEMEPNTKLTLEFDESGVKVVLSEGCVNLRAKMGTTGEIITPQGSSGKTDPAQDGRLETCPGRSAAPIVGAGIEAGGLFRLGAAAAVAIIAKGVTTVAVPVTPRGILY